MSIFRLFQKSKPTYLSLAIGALFFLGILVYAYYEAGTPYAAELKFSELSLDSQYSGAVVPASCNSNPPVDHWVGDCPLAVDVNISNSYPNIPISYSVSSLGETIVRNSDTKWTIGDGFGDCTYKEVTVNYSAPNAAYCFRSDIARWKLPNAGSFNVNILPNNETMYVFIACTDGGNWNQQILNFVGDYYIEDCNSPSE